jgi:hypothetical protein
MADVNELRPDVSEKGYTKIPNESALSMHLEECDFLSVPLHSAL